MSTINFKRSYPLKLSPTNSRVLKLAHAASAAVEGDPVQTYGDLLSAAVLAARIMNLDALIVVEHVQALAPRCDKALAKRPDIFGGGSNDNRS